jgi:hypothetical protein
MSAGARSSADLYRLADHGGTQCDPSLPGTETAERKNVFLLIFADRAGHPLDFERLNPPDMMQAMIASFAGDERQWRSLSCV